MTQQTAQIEKDVNSNSQMLSAVVGVLAVLLAIDSALFILPAALPGLAASLQADNAKVYWYLSRGSAVSAYVLLWISMILGLLLSNRLAKHWPGAPAANDLHQYVSLLGLGLTAFHAVILTGDAYLKINLAQILAPFGVASYRPVQVGLGQIAFLLWAIVAASFYVKKRIGVKTWKWIHFFSFILFGFALIHGITSGTDTGETWMQAIYWSSAASILLLTVYRILMVVANQLME
jgi:predicted ferric reductase